MTAREKGWDHVAPYRWDDPTSPLSIIIRYLDMLSAVRWHGVEIRCTYTLGEALDIAEALATEMGRA